MSNLTDQPKALDDEDLDLNYTREIRKSLITDMTKSGMPTETKDRAMLLMALDGVDKAALAKKKIKSDEGISNKNLVAVETIAHIFNTKNVREIPPSEIIGEIKEVTDVIDVSINEGELSQNSENMNFDAFMSKMQKN
jgi:hypothetical protein